MIFFVYLILFCFVVGLVGVASNPSPYFGALGLVVVAGAGCGMLISHGGPFLSLVLFMIYLGGMLVVFAYSAALAAEPYPEGWGSQPVLVYVATYMVGLSIAIMSFWDGWFESSWLLVDEAVEFSVLRGDASGVALLYSTGGVALIICGWALLLSLLVVLELGRGSSRGAVRAV